LISTFNKITLFSNPKIADQLVKATKKPLLEKKIYLIVDIAKTKCPSEITKQI